MRIIRIGEVEDRTGLSRKTIWRHEKAGRFPRRRQISSTAVGWLEQEVVEWIENRPVVTVGEEQG